MTSFDVYYSRDFEKSVIGTQELSKKDILDEVTHVNLKCCVADNIDDVFVKMQGENWSPNGEAYDLIVSKDLEHTSMSVGDVVHNLSTLKMYRCMPTGWNEIK